MKKLLQALGRVNHLFAKGIIVWCVVWGTGCSVYALRILARTGHDGASLLGVILAFLGGELLVLCLRTILSEKQQDKTAAGREDAAGQNEEENL